MVSKTQKPMDKQMGGISIKAHSNEAKNIANTADNVSEHTEIAVSFAF